MSDYVPLDAITATVRSKGRTVYGWKTEDGIGLSFDGFSDEDESRLMMLVDDDIGLTGTGWCGELRDMIAQLHLIAHDLGAEVEIPDETKLAREEEDRTSPLELGPGMAW